MLKESRRTPLGRVLGLSLFTAIALGAAPAAAAQTYVVDQNAGTGGSGALFRVDRLSGVRSLVSDFGDATQGPLGLDVTGLALEASGTVLVIDRDAGTVVQGALLRVDAGGNRSLVSDFGNAAQGPAGGDPAAVALEGGGTVLVMDRTGGTSGLGLKGLKGPGSIKCLTFHSIRTSAIKPRQPVNSDDMRLRNR
jgi:hypothetical protein